MPIKVTCQDCKASLTAKDELAGKKVKCPRCQAVLTVSAGPDSPPQQAQAASPAPPSPPKPPPPPKAAPPPMAVAVVEGPTPEEAQAAAPAAEATTSDPSAGEVPATEKANLPAIISLPLAFLVLPAAAIILLLKEDRALGGLVGGIAALGAIGCAVAGLVVAMKRRKKAVGATLSIAAICIAGISLILMAVFAMFFMGGDGKGEDPVAKAEPPPPPGEFMNVHEPDPPPPTPTAMVLLQCSQCKHEFEMAAADFVQEVMSARARMMGAGDVNDLLDQVEEQGGIWGKCPECGKTAGQFMLACPKCTKHFVPPPTALMLGGSQTCPHCGAQVSTFHAVPSALRVPGSNPLAPGGSPGQK